MTKRVLITGASSLIGYQLVREFIRDESYECFGTYLNHMFEMPYLNLEKLDLTDSKKLKSYLNKIDPDIIIHCAALVSVDACENETKKATRINVETTKILANFCDLNSKKLVYISSDYVFGGNHGNYSEDDSDKPINFYGKTKLKSEQICNKLNDALIIRTAFFGNITPSKKRSYLTWVVDKLRNKEIVESYSNHYFTPVSTITLAKIIKKLIESDSSGTYNISSDVAVSKYEFAKKVASCFDFDTNSIKGIVNDSNLIPKNSSLINTKLKKRLGIVKIDLLDEIKLIKEDDDTLLVENFVKKDSRGTLAVMFNRELPKGQVYLVTINPGEMRANHWHVRKKEWFIVLEGKVRFYFKNMIDGKEWSRIIGPESCFHKIYMPTNVLHKLVNESKKKAMVLAYIDESFTNDDPDVHFEDK